MRVFRKLSLSKLPEFPQQQDKLAIVERTPLPAAEVFFEKLLQITFTVRGQVFKESSADDIADLLQGAIPNALQSDPFYRLWVADMAHVCQHFCAMAGEASIGFCVGTQRDCRRYHKDNVPMRLLVTYAGQGTEWLPDEAVDHRAYASGMSNEDILIDPAARQFMRPWDIAVFRGGPEGLLHRTPDTALNGASILMRLDHKDFWHNVMASRA
jgi:hypothetical protein